MSSLYENVVTKEDLDELREGIEYTTKILLSRILDLTEATIRITKHNENQDKKIGKTIEHINNLVRQMTK